MKKSLCIKIIANVMTLLLVFSANSNVVCAKESTKFAISDAKFTEFIKDGVMTKEDNAYSFTITTVSDALVKNSSDNQEIVQEKLVIMPVTEEGEKNLEELLLAARANNSTTLYQSDVAGCLTANLTIYWAVGTYNNKETALLKSVNGGFTAQGSGNYVGSNVYITSQEVTCGTYGILAGNAQGNGQDVTYNPSVSTRSFSYSMPSNWVPVYAESNAAEVGANYIIKLTRGSSTWSCSIYNNVRF